MPYFKTKDTRNSHPIELHYQDWGTGAPVVFIHGWPVSLEMWEYQMTELPKHGLRCIAYDRRGFGRSSKPWDGYDYDVMADDLKALLDELDLQNVALVGFSMGGGEIARYFSRHGGARVSKVVLVSSVLPYMLKTNDNPDGVDKSVFDDMMNKLKEDRLGFLEGFGKDFFGVNAIKKPVSGMMLHYHWNLAAVSSARATQECAKSWSSTDFRKDIAAIKVPTLIIHGDADKTVPIDVCSKRASTMIPNSKYIVYEGAPHGLFYTEKERLNADLLSFIGAGAVKKKMQPAIAM